MPMWGLSYSSLKKNPALVPLFACVVVGMVGAFAYVARLATRNPDVCWDRKNNPYPWLKLKPTDQYKFHSVSVDYKKLKSPTERPEF